MFRYKSKVIVFLLVLSSLLIIPINSKELDLNIEINEYGESWEGYLAFGLFEYNQSELYDFEHGYLLIMDTEGNIKYIRDYPSQSYNEVELTSPNTLMFQGEPRSRFNFLEVKIN